MKKENIDRANEIIDKMRIHYNTIKSLDKLSYILLKNDTGGGLLHLDVGNPLVDKLKEDLIANITSEISDLEDELETL